MPQQPVLRLPPAGDGRGKGVRTYPCQTLSVIGDKAPNDMCDRLVSAEVGSEVDSEVTRQEIAEGMITSLELGVDLARLYNVSHTPMSCIALQYRAAVSHAAPLIRRCLGLSLALLGVLNISIPLPKAYAASLQDVQSLEQVTKKADRDGDFERGARAAEQCVASTNGTSANYFCAYYLSSALRSGRGVPRDEVRAFSILNDLAATDPDGDAALELAEDYLDGVGTPSNTIEAGIILWRVDHGAFSIYSDYWGMCMNCKTLGQHEEAVARRVNQELNRDEKTRVDAIVAQRYPTIAARVRKRDRQIATGILTPILLLGALLWFWRARRGAQARPYR